MQIDENKIEEVASELASVKAYRAEAVWEFNDLKAELLVILRKHFLPAETK